MSELEKILKGLMEVNKEMAESIKMVADRMDKLLLIFNTSRLLTKLEQRYGEIDRDINQMQEKIWRTNKEINDTLIKVKTLFNKLQKKRCKNGRIPDNKIRGNKVREEQLLGSSKKTM